MAKTKRAKRGAGHLFKMHLGKQYPADWKGAGAFWLAYSPGKGCKRIVQALTDTDGRPVYDRKGAEAARMRIVGAGLAGQRVEALREQLVGKLATAQEDLLRARRESVTGVMIADAWDVYEATPRAMRPDAGDSTLEQYDFQWSRFSKWIAANFPEVVTLADVTEDHATAYAADLQAAGLSGATINKHLGLLRLVFRVLKKQAGLTRDAWADMQPVKHRPRGRRELSTIELRRVCASADGELRVLLAVGLYSGLRLADCALLRWDEIDTGQNEIIVTPRKTEHTSGKQVKIPIHPSLRAILSELPKRGAYVLPDVAETYQGRRDTITDRVQRHLLDCGIDVHEPGTGQQIERDATGEPLRDDKGRVVMRSTGKRAVVRVGFHSLRHAFVSMCRAANVPMATVEALVGHSNPHVTRLYSHTGALEAERAVLALPSLTGPDVPAADKGALAGILEALEGLTAADLESVIGHAKGILERKAQ